MPSLSEERRSQLDQLVLRMEASGAPEDEIRAVISDFQKQHAAPSLWERFYDSAMKVGAPAVQAAHLGIGAAKGLGETVVGLGELVHKIPGVTETIEAGLDKVYGERPKNNLSSTITGTNRPGLSEAAFADARSRLVPTNTAQSVGKAAEQAAEFIAPGGAARHLATKAPKLIRPLTRLAAEGGAAAGTAALHGDDPQTAAVLGTAVPVVGGAVVRSGKFLKDAAPKFVQAALKPTVTAMKQTAGASRRGLEYSAAKLSKNVLENRWTSPKKAEAAIKAAESRLGQIMATKGQTPTDVGVRSVRYLRDLEKRAANQLMQTGDDATVAAARKGVVQGPLGENVTRQSTVMAPSPVLGPNGQPIMQPQTVTRTVRRLRTDVPAQEALERARGTSQWQNRRQFGELKGADTEASKTVERAARDAVKAAVPETAPVLAQQGRAIEAKAALDRMALREGNRDILGLPTVTAAAADVARGKLPLFAVAVQWLRNNQLKAGIYADVLADAIQRGDTQTVGRVLSRFGVGALTDAASPDQN